MPEMKSPQPQQVDLEELAARYDVIGELGGGPPDTRQMLARLREDGTDVLITIISPLEGDEGNALSHLAADAQILCAEAHTNILRIIDGRWLGEAFALVSVRPDAPTLEEVLLRRDEEFPYPRIATVLRDVNAALLWARERRVVHRELTPESVYLERGSDRAVVAFRVRPLGLTEMPGEAQDARTVASLARVMFTRGNRSPDETHTPLAELRPGLPASVASQTEALIAAQPGQDVPDMPSFIASIAMADALKAGEEHLAKTRHTIEAERADHEAQLEKERREHVEALTREKEAHARDRAAHERDREILRLEREAHQRDREALLVERNAHDTEVTTVIAQRARRRTRAGLLSLAVLWQKRPQWRSSWSKPAVVAALVMVGAVAAVAVAKQGRWRQTGGRPTVATSAPARPARVADSAAGTTGPRVVAPVPADLLSGVAKLSEDPEAPTRFSFAPAIQNRFEEPAYQAPRPRPRRQLDTIFTTPTIPKPDSIAKPDSAVRDSLARPKPDSTVRRDTLRNTISKPS